MAAIRTSCSARAVVAAAAAAAAGSWPAGMNFGSWALDSWPAARLAVAGMLVAGIVADIGAGIGARPHSRNWSRS